jgi:DNA invertase Pin-like site-specific DNA recombinase
MSDKLKESHLSRAAVVYVRQSSMDQVRNNHESRRRQYALAGRAKQLGFTSVEVIDDDLGRSGAGKQARPGFARLVAAVCEGAVGAVLVVEASRLARNGRDWHHLIDLCSLANTLVIDHDGIYDPAILNDRLLLGLKGTMAEFELGLLRQRSIEALRQMIARGEVLWLPAVGYVRTHSNRIEITPDRQVQQAVQGVFEKFRELGSARQVLLWHRQEKLPLPSAISGTHGVEVTWSLPGYQRIIAILKNPVYAGAFVWGRSETRTTVVDGRARASAGHYVPIGNWKVLLREHHPGYIGWDEYLENQELLNANSGMAGRMGTGAAKSGAAMLAGLLRCARCGRKLHVSYGGVGGRVPRYHCKGAQINHGEDWCISFGGARVDERVSAVVIDALGPLGIEASLTAAQELTNQNDQKRKALSLAAEKARYEVALARRKYDAVDPANRLVAAELEKRWNDALQDCAEAEARLASTAIERDEISEEERARLLELGGDLRQLWNHPGASSQLRKRILRTVLEEIVVDVSDDPPEVRFRLHWVGGVHTELNVSKNRTGRHQRSTDRNAIEVMRSLAEIVPDDQIARILNMLGYQSGHGNPWSSGRVRSARQYHKIPAFDRTRTRPWLTLAETATHLGVSAGVVRRLLNSGVVSARQVAAHAPWMIDPDNLGTPEVEAAVRAVKAGRRASRLQDRDREMPLFPTM